MKAVILAGGLGTRISEETSDKPKPMIEIGGKPILWHIMKIYSTHNIKDFIVCCGYKSSVIKNYFLNYANNKSDVTINLKDNTARIHNNESEDWTVTLAETGDLSMTGGRLKRAKKYLNDETFCMTYGDGLSDINISELVKFHKANGGLGTFTAVRPPARFGTFTMNDRTTKVKSFIEKGAQSEHWINAGYFVLEPKALDLIIDDSTVWEEEPLKMLADQGNLNVYKHEGFWQCMDTLKDKHSLESLWQSKNPPWKIW